MTDQEAQQIEQVLRTQSAIAYEQLRNDIIKSELPASSRLRIRDLCTRYGYAISSVREALARLTSEGLVQLIEHRGFTVSPTTETDLEELTKARCWLNERALRESIKHGDLRWEEGVLLSYHRMTRTPRYAPSKGSSVRPEWDAAHRAFHASLISACGSNWIFQYCEQLFNAADRYRHLARLMYPDHLDDGHRQIMEATLARDADQAVKLLVGHFRRTAEFGRLALARQRTDELKGSTRRSVTRKTQKRL